MEGKCDRKLFNHFFFILVSFSKIFSKKSFFSSPSFLSLQGTSMSQSGWLVLRSPLPLLVCLICFNKSGLTNCLGVSLWLHRVSTQACSASVTCSIFFFLRVGSCKCTAPYNCQAPMKDCWFTEIQDCSKKQLLVSCLQLLQDTLALFLNLLCCDNREYRGRLVLSPFLPKTALMTFWF